MYSYLYSYLYSHLYFYLFIGGLITAALWHPFPPHDNASDCHDHLRLYSWALIMWNQEKNHVAKTNVRKQPPLGPRAAMVFLRQKCKCNVVLLRSSLISGVDAHCPTNLRGWCRKKRNAQVPIRTHPKRTFTDEKEDSMDQGYDWIWHANGPWVEGSHQQRAPPWFWGQGGAMKN